MDKIVKKKDRYDRELNTGDIVIDLKTSMFGVYLGEDILENPGSYNLSQKWSYASIPIMSKDVVKIFDDYFKGNRFQESVLLSTGQSQMREHYLLIDRGSKIKVTKESMPLHMQKDYDNIMKLLNVYKVCH